MTDSGALEAVDRILNRGGDVDDVLRGVVDVLVDRAGAVWAGVLFVEQERLELGPQRGEPDETRRVQVPIAYHGDRVGELAADGDLDRALLERVALLISPYVLLGWDTGGEGWAP